ncbi:hypothetical protein K469DRAFT_708197, partial [Zopfia rhizophila CBS 207.26]
MLPKKRCSDGSPWPSPKRARPSPAEESEDEFDKELSAGAAAAFRPDPDTKPEPEKKNDEDDDEGSSSDLEKDMGIYEPKTINLSTTPPHTSPKAKGKAKRGKRSQRASNAAHKVNKVGVKVTGSFPKGTPPPPSPASSNTSTPSPKQSASDFTPKSHYIYTFADPEFGKYASLTVFESDPLPENEKFKSVGDFSNFEYKDTEFSYRKN